MAGGGGSGVEPRPAGDVVAQGSLTGLNGSTVTGAVTVYVETGGTALTLRLEGLSISPSENTFLMTAEVTGAADYTTNLRYVSGNANYTTGIYSPNSVTRVLIESLSRAPPREVASAALTAPRAGTSRSGILPTP